jgi:hypothetical protein
MNSTIDCSVLGSRHGFSDYIATLNATTGGNSSAIRECKAEICAALWGTGNPDISGVGVRFRQQVLGFSNASR